MQLKIVLVLLSLWSLGQSEEKALGKKKRFPRCPFIKCGVDSDCSNPITIPGFLLPDGEGGFCRGCDITLVCGLTICPFVSCLASQCDDPEVFPGKVITYKDDEGKTRRCLGCSGFICPCEDIFCILGFPACLDGRLITLPGEILFDRGPVPCRSPCPRYFCIPNQA